MRHWIALTVLVLLAGSRGAHADDAPAYFCRPTQPCWPSDVEWTALRGELAGELIQPAPAPPSTSPFELQDAAGATQSQGWIDAWTSAPSTYAVVAKSAADIAAAVKLAHAHHLRVVVKGTGHDYLGRSSAPDSLLIWTHAMRAITVVDAFTPAGCKPGTPAVPAVTVEAGVRWLEAYREVTGKHGRYVQGGGCTSVGAAGGFLQGGGFGSWSNKYGIAAASLVEAEVVLADGQIVTANACQHADLFWALRGGGGGTYGVVTKATLRTYELPTMFGRVAGTIAAKTDADYADLIDHFVAFYRASLADEHWGESVVLHDDKLDIGLASQGLTVADEEKIWAPFRAWLDAQQDRYTVKLDSYATPAATMWSWDFFTKAHYPISGTEQGWWWTSNEEEVGVTWSAYQSRWITRDHFTGAAGHALAAALVKAAHEWTVSIHFQKGQAAAAADARARDREIAMNPQVLDAAGLAIIGALGDAKDRGKLEHDRDRVAAAMKILAAATPGAGSYVNETDYFEADWKRAFWGANYRKLLAIKHKYDPDGVFFCHHCVGSDEALARAH